MRILIVFQTLSLLMPSKAATIGMFDFKNRNSSRCLKESYQSNDTVNDLAAAVLKIEPKGKLPEKATICVTIYADVDDCYTPYNKEYPTWGFVGEGGRVNLSLFLQPTSTQFKKMLLFPQK